MLILYLFFCVVRSGWLLCFLCVCVLFVEGFSRLLKVRFPVLRLFFFVLLHMPFGALRTCPRTCLLRLRRGSWALGSLWGPQGPPAQVMCDLSRTNGQSSGAITLCQFTAPVHVADSLNFFLAPPGKGSTRTCQEAGLGDHGGSSC